MRTSRWGLAATSRYLTASKARSRSSTWPPPMRMDSKSCPERAATSSGPFSARWSLAAVPRMRMRRNSSSMRMGNVPGATRSRKVRLGSQVERATLASVSDRKSTRLDPSPTEIYALSLHDALPISAELLLDADGQRSRRDKVEERALGIAGREDDAGVDVLAGPSRFPAGQHRHAHRAAVFDADARHLGLGADLHLRCTRRALEGGDQRRRPPLHEPTRRRLMQQQLGGRSGGPGSSEGSDPRRRREPLHQ